MPRGWACGATMSSSKARASHRGAADWRCAATYSSTISPRSLPMPKCLRPAARSCSAGSHRTGSSTAFPGTKSAMPSFVLPDEIPDVARRLSPESVARVVELRKGNNSRIFRVETRDACFALKKYPATDSRDRLGAEVAAVRFFQRSGIGHTPQVVAVAPEIRFALFTWIEGAPVQTVTDDDVAQFAAFQLALDGAIDAR